METNTNTIFNEDCIGGMKRIPDSCVDLIITDPPFAIGFQAQKRNYNREQSRVIEGYKEIDKNNYYDFTLSWMREARRVMKESGSCYIFSGWNNLGDIINAANELDLETVNHIIWKYQFGVVTTRKFVTSHYHCLFLCKNDKKRKFYPYRRFGKDERGKNRESLHYQDKEDVWIIKREYWTGHRKTPTKLPAELIEKILQYSSDEGDLVLDPFLGSGQVAVVSKMLGRNYTGFEISEEYFNFAQERLQTGRYRI